MAQLQRALFRSFLRWNRRKYILESRFRLNPVDFQCKELFPPSTIIRDASGFQGALFYAFRNTPASPKATNDAVRILRQLNDFALQVKESSERRHLNSNEQTIAFAKYRIGQVVQNKETKVRGVVIGWKVNFSRKTQTVQIISDFDDTNKQTKYDISIRPEFVSASELELVEDPTMMRIFHFDTDKYFIAFDEKHHRYIPNAELLYLYPRDFDNIYNPDVHGGAYPAGVSKNDLAFLERVNALVCDRGDRIHELSARFFPWREESSESGSFNSSSDTELNFKIISDEILNELWWRLGRIRQKEGHLPPSTHSYSSGADSPMNLSYVEGFNQSLNYADVQGNYVFPAKTINVRGEKKIGYDLAKSRFEKQLNALHSPWLPIRNIYHRIGHLNELMTHLDQLLQLRFQSRGIAFCASLAPSTETIQYTYVHTDPVSNGINTKEFTPNVFPLTRNEFHISVQQYMDATNKVFRTKFQLGQVVRHKKYGYRGIVTGNDQRPLMQASKRADLLANAGSDVPRGQEQPFYRLLVDERDEMLFREGGSHEHGQLVFDHTYVPEDCLEPVIASTAQDQHLLIVSHPEINHYFLGWNSATQRFRPRHQLKYAFSEGDHSIPDDYPHRRILQALEERIAAEKSQASNSDGIDRATDSGVPSPFDSSESSKGIQSNYQLYSAATRSILREEIKIYESIDSFLVFLSEQINEFLGSILDRHLERLSRFQREQQLQKKPISDETPIGKPTITSRGRKLRKSPPIFAEFPPHVKQNAHAPKPLIAMELRDLQRLLQLAPLRFASLDVDLWMHKVLASLPISHVHSHDMQALVRLAAAHAIRGNFAETIRGMDLATRLEPLLFEAYYKQALGWSRLGDTHAVVKLSLQTLALWPHHQGAHYLLALAYSNTKRKDEAVEVIKQGLRLNPWAFNLASDLKTLLQE